MAGNQGNNRVIWEQWQLDFLIKNFKAMSAQELSDAIGIKRTKVREKYYELGLKKMELEYWTQEQIQYLVDNYKLLGDTEIAEIFQQKWSKIKGWTKKHIEKKRNYLKLHRSKDEIREIHRRNVSNGMFSICPVKAWDKRGRAAFGEKRVWTSADGRSYVVIKVKGGFVHYARWLYEQVFGSVPPGCVVRLKDGDHLNVAVGNLLLVTRAQNASINSQNRCPELAMSRKIIHKINLITKDHEKQTK